jgi:hypothetical protein
MIMRELHYKDGRPFGFDQAMVRFLSPHESGEGTLMRLDPIASPVEIHVQEDYQTAYDMVTLGSFARALKNGAYATDLDDEDGVPFG